MNDIFVALNRLRLDHDWTYDELAARLGISRRNLLRLCGDPNARMRDRTAARIRRFIKDTDRVPPVRRLESRP